MSNGEQILEKYRNYDISTAETLSRLGVQERGGGGSTTHTVVEAPPPALPDTTTAKALELLVDKINTDHITVFKNALDLREKDIATQVEQRANVAEADAHSDIRNQFASQLFSQQGEILELKMKLKERKRHLSDNETLSTITDLMGVIGKLNEPKKKVRKRLGFTMMGTIMNMDTTNVELAKEQVATLINKLKGNDND